jgi:hypothetical protein
MPTPSCPPRANSNCSDMGELSLPALFSQLSHELAALQRMAADMEATVDDMIERQPGALDATSIRNLQLLDILNQTLLALARFAANAAALSAPEWQVDGPAAVSGLTLAGLAQRLAGGKGCAVKDEAESYELFT